MEELIQILEELKGRFKNDDVKRLKIDLAISTLSASEDISKLVKRNNPKAVFERIVQLGEDHMNIRTKFTLDGFPNGGIYRPTITESK